MQNTTKLNFPGLVAFYDTRPADSTMLPSRHIHTRQTLLTDHFQCLN